MATFPLVQGVLPSPHPPVVTDYPDSAQVRGRGHLPSGAGVLNSPHPPVVTDYPASAQVRWSGTGAWPPSLWCRGPTLASPTIGYRLPCLSSGKVVRYGGVATFPLMQGVLPSPHPPVVTSYPDRILKTRAPTRLQFVI